MSKKFFVSFILFFIVAIGLTFTILDMFEPKKEVKIAEKESQFIKEFSYRKYLHVRKFYQDIAKGSIDIALKYNIPPAAVLAIAGVESGYGRGYVGRITGNILSLGAKKGEAQLPSLYLPNLKKDRSKILYGDLIDDYKKSELRWKQRPKSLKKDYRPSSIAGSHDELDFFDKNREAKKIANLACIEDFAKIWINKNKKFKPFVDARAMLDEQVKLHSKEILFDRDINVLFIKMISGKVNSFNYRKTWAPKVTKIMNNIGLVELTKSLHGGDKSFAQLW